MFKHVFNQLVENTINDLVRSFKYGGSDQRQQHARTGATRMSQNIVPDVHKPDASNNGKIEHLRGVASGKTVCNRNDLMHIINTYIKQGDQEPCTAHNVDQMASKYLAPSKNLGTTGIKVVHNPINNSFMLVK